MIPISDLFPKAGIHFRDCFHDCAQECNAGMMAESILAQLSGGAGGNERTERKNLIAQKKLAWVQELTSVDHELDDPGTTWNERARKAKADLMSPRKARQANKAAWPKEAIISSDIGNNRTIGNACPGFGEGRKYLAAGLLGPCGYGLPSIQGAKIGQPGVAVVGFAGDGAFGIPMNEMTAIGRDDWPVITTVIFRNDQWAGEKRNTIHWYHADFIGADLNQQVSNAGNAKACGLEGVQVDCMSALTAALRTATQDQKEGKTNFIEVLLDQERGQPFRRDAMKTPVAVAGIDPADMRLQAGD